MDSSFNILIDSSLGMLLVRHDFLPVGLQSAGSRSTSTVLAVGCGYIVAANMTAKLSNLFSSCVVELFVFSLVGSTLFSCSGQLFAPVLPSDSHPWLQSRPLATSYYFAVVDDLVDVRRLNPWRCPIHFLVVSASVVSNVLLPRNELP